jgi:3-deoxy-D-manno-octulosonate 8-phosphate phosphatase (KDO 8-P phosphatase)
VTLIDRFKNITTFVFDVDGVLTDGSVHVFDNGEQVRTMNIKDGFALQLAVKKGYHVIVISGGNSPAAVSRLNKLGITDIFMGTHDKRAVLQQIMQEKSVQKEQLLFMGDDIPDYTAMLEVGLPCAPADAVSEILKISLYVSPKEGGRGCVRDVIERVLKLNGHWELKTDVPSR